MGGLHRRLRYPVSQIDHNHLWLGTRLASSSAGLRHRIDLGLEAVLSREGGKHSVEFMMRAKEGKYPPRKRNIGVTVEEELETRRDDGKPGVR